ncbi:MAG: TIGR01777 family oxidoreductase [Nocardioidaceae bacterium]
MKIAVAGASGFLGTALVAELARRRHHVVRLVRRPPGTEGESSWDPYQGSVDLHLIGACDAVLNLAGASLAHWPWTADYREQIVSSRVATTRTLADAILKTGGEPAYVVGSAMARYGEDRGAEILTEESTDGAGFLPDVVRAWEAAAEPARAAGARVCHVRSSVVLDKRSGALKLMRLPFSLGVGGRLGSGAQYFSSITLHDWVRGVLHLLENGESQGAYNFSSPHPVTNAEFTKALGAALHRPTVLPVPGFALRSVLGDLSNQLLGSLRIQPARLLAEGFAFDQPDIESSLAAALA